MDADKLKNLFILHFEKGLVVLFLGVSGFLVYSGLSLPMFLNEKKKPEALTQEARQVRTSIDEDHNEAVLVERLPTLFDIVSRTQKSSMPVDPSDYRIESPWELKSISGAIRRQDPQLVAPRELRVQGVIASIAVNSATGDYLIKSLEAADEVKKVEAPKPRAPRGRGRMNEMEMMMMGGGDPSMMDPSMMDPSMMDPSMMDPSMMGGGSMAGAMGPQRRLDPLFNFGYTPMPTMTGGKKPVPETAWFIAGTAVMPHAEMFAAFDAALKDADGYVPMRDQPIYYNLEVQRADVTDRPIDAVADNDWVLRGSRAVYLDRARRVWAGFAKELVPGEYRDPAFTSYIPPVLLDDYSTFSLHPLVPLEVPKLLPTNTPVVEEAEQEVLLPGQQPDMIFNTPAAAAGGMMSDFGGMAGGYSGMSMQMGTTGSKPVDYKLIRFYDFVDPRDPTTPRPGRKYVYRLRVAIVDPNFPLNPASQPRGGTLSAEVYRRYLELTAAEQKAGSRTKDLLFQRWTDWSEPSPAVSLPDREQFFVGPVKAGAIRMMRLGNRPIPYARDESTAKLVTTQYDLKYRARIPMVMDVMEGSVLSAKGTAEVVDPITLEIKKLPDASLVSGTTVIDLDGGTPLEISPGEKMTQPAMMLLFDENGGLTVSDEVSDQEFYRIYSYAKERGE